VRFCEFAEEEREKPDQPGAEEAKVVAGGGEDDVDDMAGGAGKEMAAEMTVLHHVTDYRLDAGVPPELTAFGERNVALQP
jgi:hypothetical protein